VPSGACGGELSAAASTRAWQLARTAETQVSGGDPKKGDKVTILYEMTATKIEVKPEKSAKASKAKK
jgi:hypothetical protein